jgi:HK97 family phage major capsid protein
MQSTGSMDRASETVSDLKSAMDEFTNEISELKSRINLKPTKESDPQTMLDQKTLAPMRPALSRAYDVDTSHKSAFDAYIRNGDDDALRGLELKGKGMVSAVAADGGYLVDPATSDTIKSSLRSAASIRSIAQVVNVDATSYDVLVDHADIGAGWATEASTMAETGTPQIDRVSITLHELCALPKASQRLLDDSAFDIENWLADRIADKFARSEGAAFVSGDGVDKPTGFLTYETVEAGSETWGKIGHVRSGAAGDFEATNPAGALVDLVYALGAQYRANGTFVMNSKTAGRVRKLRDADGRFLWSDSLASDQPARLLGYPVLISEDMPDIDDWSPAIAFGDFNAGYTIAERPDLRIMRDPFSAKPHVLFYATKRIGGDVTDFNAIKVLKFAA